jgi:hypothetical protein
MSKQQVNSKYVLAGVAVVLLLVLAMSYAYYTNTPKQTTMGTILIVNYSDGTRKTFDSGYQPLGLAITDLSGKTINNVQVELYVTPVFTGTVSSYSLSGGTMNMQVWLPATSANYGNVKIYDSGNVALSPFSPLPTLTNGKATVITSATLTASQLQALPYSQSLAYGTTYTLHYYMTTPLTVALQFADGTSGSQSATAPSVSWSFIYASSSSFTSLSCTFQVNPS